MNQPESSLVAEHLPASVAELVGIIGLPATLAIVEERGGLRFYVPVQPRPDHWLARLIGMAAFTRLVEYAAGDEIEVPRCLDALRAAKDRQIAQDAAAGDSQATLARRYGYTERGIRKVLRRIERAANDNQPELF
tara:strand:+ start:426 stop:830 length:405 start_codon:yes stop_codon:yes gene_type:complete